MERAGRISLPNSLCAELSFASIAVIGFTVVGRFGCFELGISVQVYTCITELLSVICSIAEAVVRRLVERERPRDQHPDAIITLSQTAIKRSVHTVLCVF